MFENFKNSLKNLKNTHKRSFQILFGSNISLYISVIVWIFLTSWDTVFYSSTLYTFFFSAVTSGIGLAYLLFTWFFYIYVRCSDSLVDLVLSVLKIIGHFIIIVSIFTISSWQIQEYQNKQIGSYLIERLQNF